MLSYAQGRVTVRGYAQGRVTVRGYAQGGAPASCHGSGWHKGLECLNDTVLRCILPTGRVLRCMCAQLEGWDAECGFVWGVGGGADVRRERGHMLGGAGRVEGDAGLALGQAVLKEMRV